MNEIEKIIAPARHSLQRVPLTESMVNGGTIGKLQRALEEKEALIRDLTKALGFYADEQNYDEKVGDNQWGPWIPVLEDRGQRASVLIQRSE